jgi:hypothetical protein
MRAAKANGAGLDDAESTVSATAVAAGSGGIASASFSSSRKSG